MAVSTRCILVVALALLATACSPDEPAAEVTPSSEATTSTTVAVTRDDPPSEGDFDQFVNEIGWDLLRRSPQSVTDLGLDALTSTPIDQLDDLSHAYRSETAAMAERALERLDTLSSGQLSPDQRVTEAVLRWYLGDLVAMHGFADHEYAVNYITGAHADFPEWMADVQPVDSIEDAEAYINRLHMADEQMQHVAENLDRSDRIRALPTDTGIRIALWQIDNVLGAPDPHPLVTDFAERLASVPSVSETQAATLVEAADAAVRESVLPGYRSLRDSVNRITTRSDDVPGVHALPNGREYYAAVLAHHLTLEMPPEEVHALGERHVARLVGELTVALEALGHDVDRIGFPAAVSQARADAGSFRLTSEADREMVLDLTKESIDEMTSTVAPMFVTLPSSALEVQRPRPGREGGSGAYYRAPPVYGDRPGIYYLSLGGPSLDTQTLATTNAHEAVPGHHFQLALQRESAELPLLQRSVVFTGYAEGWALYAERLAHEAGAYDDDPQGNVGRLRMELLRAARAVVDTGIHHFGWTHSEAVGYMTDLGFARERAIGEVDRYVVWPGQAPAYIIGLLEIERVRALAEDALGDGFDLAAFHHEVLRHGSIPLASLEPVTRAFIQGS